MSVACFSPIAVLCHRNKIGHEVGELAGYLPLAATCIAAYTLAKPHERPCLGTRTRVKERAQRRKSR